ncbi:hypothetical protein VNI00_015768 [Paramarasmius palmivorus]|uniref:Cytochrome P450 n=1 Tax=Paramarasmius palmivorus TaxID=297713 RepID=A0AAW0BIK5_9AGAR
MPLVNGLLWALGLLLTFYSWSHFRRNKIVASLLGPKPSSWLYGNLPELLFTKSYGEYEYGWQKTFGMTYRLQGCMGESRVFTSDPVALRAMFKNNKVFVITQYHRYLASMLMGDSSVFGATHAVHRRIRTVFNPAFTQGYSQSLLPIVQTIANKLAEKIGQDCGQSSHEADGHQYDIYEIIQHATSDVVAEAVMGYQFNSIETGGDEVSKNHHNVIALSSSRTKSALLADSFIPYIPRWIFNAALHLPIEGSQGILRYQKVMKAWSSMLLRQKKDNLNLGIRADGDLLSTNSTDTAVVEANEEQKGSTKLNPDEIKHQIPSVMGNTIAFALHEFAQCPEWQAKVRDEVIKARESRNGELRASDFDKLLCLNAHIKEILRFYAPLPITERETSEDTVLPLSKPVITKDGREITEIPLRKGEVIICALASYNRNTEIWGEDADTFNPYRWLDERAEHESGKSSVGPYANLILETQVILAELVAKFCFDPVKGPQGSVRPAVAITLQPVSEQGVPHLPLLVKPAETQWL